MKITVSGIGYVGLANAVLFAQYNDVTAFDISDEKAALVNKRIAPFEDKEITEYLTKQELKLTATSDKSMAYSGVPDYIIIATPTDYDTEKNFFNTSSVESVINDVSKMSPSSTIVIKSTVPIGFTERMRKQYPNLEIIFSPEFLREGKALYDNLYPSRIIVSGNSHKATDFVALILQCTKKQDVPVCYMSPTEAEAVKLFSNTYLALRIAYFNELDTFSEINCLDAKSIIEGVCLDPRIGDHYNNPSFGYGGYCLPKDTMQLEKNYSEIPQRLISAIVDSNKARKEHISAMIEKKCPKTAGIYKLSMKADSDNYRSSAVLDIIKTLQKKHITVVLYDPSIKKQELFGCLVINDFNEFNKTSDIIIANRMSGELMPIQDKVYSRDIFIRD
jgi:UDPglucose 6-dehydrogenase